VKDLHSIDIRISEKTEEETIEAPHGTNTDESRPTTVEMLHYHKLLHSKQNTTAK